MVMADDSADFMCRYASQKLGRDLSSAEASVAARFTSRAACATWVVEGCPVPKAEKPAKPKKSVRKGGESKQSRASE